MIRTSSILLLTGLLGVVAGAEGPTVLVWTGEGDGITVADPANWSGTPDGGSIDVSNLTEILVIDDAGAEVGGRGGAPTLTFVDDGGLEMYAGRLTRGAANQAIESGYVLVAGGTVDRQWISRSTVRLEGTGRIEFSGAADPVPNGTIIDLGSMLCGVDFLSETASDFLVEHIAKFRVNGAAAVHGLNVQLETYNEGNGCTVSILTDICPGDLDGNLIVDGADLADLLAAWGPANDSDADITDDGIVDGQDLSVLLGTWGDCDVGPEVPGCGSPKHCDILYPAP